MSTPRVLPVRIRRSLVVHGVAVVVLGLLAGFPYALVISGDLPGEVRAWRMAHLEGVLNGLVLIGVGAAGGLIALTVIQARWLHGGLLAAGYGNVVAAGLGAAFGVRGLAPTGPPANLLVFLLFAVAIAGVFVGLALAGWGALRRAPETAAGRGAPEDAAGPAPASPDHDTFRRAVEARDLDAMMAAFAEGALLHSPVSFKPFEGRDAIRQLLGVLFQVFRDFRYTDELAEEGGARALVFRARVGSRELEGLDLLRFDDAGLIREFTVMVRPRSALEALFAEVAPRLAEVQRQASPEAASPTA